MSMSPGKRMNPYGVRTITGAVLAMLSLGAAEIVTAQPHEGHGSMNWDNPSQYGIPEILGVLIGVAVLVLLVMLVVKTSKK